METQSISEDQLVLRDQLVQLGQREVLNRLNTPDQWNNLFSDVKSFELRYPGGIIEYIKNGRKQLKLSTNNSNPMEGFKATIPQGINLSFGSDEFFALEKEGKTLLQHCGFVVTGGGIGERLNYNHIKLSLTTDLIRDHTYLEQYCTYIHSIEEEFNCRVPLAILVSEATDEPTKVLLEENSFFGLEPSNVTFLKQEGVPSFLSPSGDLALQEDGHLVMKPHGNGDIHLLMFQSQLATQWHDQGIQYILFFQDTNSLATNAFASLIGASERYDYHFTSTAIRRKPGEKVGGICKLESDSVTLTCNVEYMQLDSVLIASTGKPDYCDESGFSPYPGNINVLCVKTLSYIPIINKSSGLLPEYVNPKYLDISHTTFLSPARLECTMEDYPKLLIHSSYNVGFVSLPRWYCFSAVKNCTENAVQQALLTGYPESIFSGEVDLYKYYRKLARERGVDLGMIQQDDELTGVSGIPEKPIIMETVRSGLTSAEIMMHMSGNVKISSSSVILLDGRDITIQNCTIDGTLVVKACEGACVCIHDSVIQNKGWNFMKIDTDKEGLDDKYVLRGYQLKKDEEYLLVFDKPGKYDIVLP